MNAPDLNPNILLTQAGDRLLVTYRHEFNAHERIEFIVSLPTGDRTLSALTTESIEKIRWLLEQIIKNQA